MSRTACVDLPAFPLQLLLRDHPDWHLQPAVVVAEDKPQARVLFVNEAGYRLGVLPGMRYAAALSLSGGLCADVVSQERVAHGLEDVIALLRKFSPAVEAWSELPGVFWLSGRGLARLYHCARAWGDAMSAALKDVGYLAGVVVGWSRFGSYAVACALGGVHEVVAFHDADQEGMAAGRVPLDRLLFEHSLRESLKKLGITCMGAFLKLPAASVRERFGNAAFSLHQLASGTAWQPLEAKPWLLPLTSVSDLEYPISRAPTILKVVERLLLPLLDGLEQRHELLRSLKMVFHLERGQAQEESVLEPAEASKDAEAILELVRLRLESLRLKAPVSQLDLTVIGSRTRSQQGELFARAQRRDMLALGRALARIRAELGNEAVVYAVLQDGHLPEASFAFEPLAAAPPSAQAQKGERVLVRRFYAKPLALDARPRHGHDNGWLIRGLDSGAVITMKGPDVVSGGWWRRIVHREYHLFETKRGDLLWAFYDRCRRRWFLHGEVL